MKATKRPDDYLTYFNEDGSAKQNPFCNTIEGSLDFKAAYLWGSRKVEIMRSLMTQDELDAYDKYVKTLQERMNA